jgi:hypothetical protein
MIAKTRKESGALDIIPTYENQIEKMTHMNGRWEP